MKSKLFWPVVLALSLIIGIVISFSFDDDSYSPFTLTNSTVRSFNSGFVVSQYKWSSVNYTVQISSSISLTTGQTGTVFLETSPDNSTWTEISRFSNGNTGTLTIGLSLVQTVTAQLQAIVPDGYYTRLRTTGTATITYLTGQELLF